MAVRCCKTGCSPTVILVSACRAAEAAGCSGRSPPAPASVDYFSGLRNGSRSFQTPVVPANCNCSIAILNELCRPESRLSSGSALSRLKPGLHVYNDNRIVILASAGRQQTLDFRSLRTSPVPCALSPQDATLDRSVRHSLRANKP